MRPTIDLGDLDAELARNPRLRDASKLAERLGKASRQHFKGRDVDSFICIDAAMAMIQAALRQVAPEDRDETIRRDIIERLQWFMDFLEGIGAPAQGEA